MSHPTRPVVTYYGKRSFRDPGDLSRFNLTRFRVDEITGCHVWLGALLYKKGYAVVGNRAGTFLAHRLTYLRDKGPIPPGMYPDHLCRNRACINSAHLELVTNAENAQRGAAAKLTWALVRDIRRRYAAGGETNKSLGAEYGVSGCAISNILTNKRWKEDNALASAELAEQWRARHPEEDA